MLSKNQLKLVRSLEQKKNRRREGLFVAEGPKVVGDLLKAGFVAHTVFSTTAQPNAQQVTEEELRRLSFLQHPQQVLAVLQIPASPQTAPIHLSDGKLALALDGVQDPGNMGTIVRIADWFGISAIYCSMDCADVYGPKVVQATMGSLAHVPVTYCDLVTLLRQTDVPIYGTLLDGSNLYEEELSASGIIVMGNEGNGISQPVRQLLTHRLLIPNYHATSDETAESLNVAIATAITCAEFQRRLHGL